MNTRNRNNPEMINRPVSGTRLADGGFRTALALFTCLFLAWSLFAADFAGAAPYKGKTKGGSSITFALKGKKVTGIRTVVPTLCLETTGGYASRAGSELFQPTAAARVGRTVKSKALQPAAMNVGAKATKNYEVSLKQRGKTVSGKLKLNFSFLIPDLYGAHIYICSGTTTFSARPR
ncbi:MAG: hypothetical protein KDB54_07730 [Solirubrobacterales bacterium]|nr:hypothetical protein [Solirubrobacterales bacterium]MCB0860530.1 hypothetical protein [Solirubrobacterales bacterium]HRV60448.1 hypothetical protein [Solirubrobacterales bacterium]